VDTFTTIWNRIRSRASALDPLLCQDIVRDSLNRLASRRDWSWRRKHSAFFPSIYYATGTVSISPNSVVVTGVGTAWTAAMVGAQFRIGSPATSFPTYTITQVIDSTTLQLDSIWIGATITTQPYQIFQCYFPVPADFESFYSLVNITSDYRIWTNTTQAELDMADPQRSQSGLVYAASFYDYTKSYNGIVGPVIQVLGSGAAPVSSSSYGFSFPANSIYVVTIILGGASGVATFQWRQDSGAFSLTQTTSTDAIPLSNGVEVYFPVGTYVAGNVFIIQCTADAVTGVPRYELWPRPINTPIIYPFAYNSKLPDLTDATPALPPFVAQRGDVLLEMGLEQCAMWPGTETMRNPYYDLNLATRHRQRAETLIYELEMLDDNTAAEDLTYQNLPYHMVPWMDGSWQQRHAIYPG